MIKQAGVGYSLKIVVVDSNGFAVASQFTSVFTVSVGPIYKQQFFVAIGAALGGRVFSPDPRIAVVDQGGNVVTAVSGTTCTAFLSMSPSGQEVLYPLVRLPAVFVLGVATFNQLYIKPQGFPYQVSFNTSSTGVSQCYDPQLQMLYFCCQIFHIWYSMNMSESSEKSTVIN